MSHSSLARRARSDVLLLALVSIVMQFIPGFNYLDFHFSMAMSVPIAAAVGGMAIAGFFDTKHHLWRSIGFALLYLGVPLAISLVGSVFNGMCNPLYSLGFYIMGPVASAVFAWGLGVGMAGLTNRRKWAFTGFYLVLIGSFVENAWYFYTQPSTNFYNPFLGFFPGPIYETAIRIGPPYLYFRLVTTMMAVWLALGGRILRGKGFTPRLTWAVIMVIAWVLALAAGNGLGYRVTLTRVRAVLNQEMRKANIVLRYSKKTGKDYASAVLEDATVRWQDLERFFGVSDHRRITIYLYPDDETSTRLIGTSSVDVAKVWLQQVHITPYTLGDEILEHELAHCFAARFSNTFLRIPFDHWIPRLDLTEGMAVAAAFDSTPLSPNEWAAAMYASGHGVDPRKFAGFAGFATSAPGKAYIVVGSFMRFLHDRYGAKAIEAVYRAGSYRVLGKGLDSLVKEWITYLAHYRVPKQFIGRARVLASAKGVLHTLCLTERSRLKQSISRSFHAANLKQALFFTKKLAHIVDTPRIQGFIAYLNSLAGNSGAVAAWLSGYLSDQDPDMAALALKAAAPLIRSPLELRYLLPAGYDPVSYEWSEVGLLECAAMETGALYPELIRGLALPNQEIPGLAAGPCSAYLLAIHLFETGKIARACRMNIRPGLLASHFQRFNGYLMQAWCSLLGYPEQPDVLKKLRKEALYEGERMAAQKIRSYVGWIAPTQ